jgi:hypothetical protein
VLAVAPELIDHSEQVAAQALMLARLGEQARQFDQLGLDGRGESVVRHSRFHLPFGAS